MNDDAVVNMVYARAMESVHPGAEDGRKVRVLKTESCWLAHKVQEKMNGARVANANYQMIVDAEYRVNVSGDGFVVDATTRRVR